MATLPQAADYGARIKLVSNRIDIPGSGEMAVAEALEKAAATFAVMVIEHKEKDDALSYAHAKNEYLIADIEERAKLQDDQDFISHGRRYNEAMKGHYERLFPTVRSSRDRSLFDAEARLMTTRGTVAVADNARVKEIDWNVAELSRHGRKLEGVIMAASDAQTARDGMSAYLEHINSLLKKGLIGQTEHETWSKDFVTSVAGKRLIAMDPKLREQVLERSITLAKTQGRITRDQIFAGEGSDSIADFLPLDERVKMLEITRKGNEYDDDMTEAWMLFDKVRAVYTDPQNVSDEIRRISIGLPQGVRTALASMNREYQTEETRLEARERQSLYGYGQSLLEEGKNPELVMAGQQWKMMLPQQRVALHEGYISRQQRDGFGEVDTLYTVPKADFDAGDHIIDEDGNILMGESTPEPSYAYWSGLTELERSKIRLEDEHWRQAFTFITWQGFLDEQKEIRKRIAAGKAPDESPGLTPMQRVTASLVTMKVITATDRSEEHWRKYWSAVQALDRKIRIAERVKGSKLTAANEAEIWANMLADKAFTDHFFSAAWWPGGPTTDPSKMVPIVSMDPATKRKGRTAFTADHVTVHGGQPMTHRMKLEAMARSLTLVAEDVSDLDYERANFALINLIGTDGFRYDPETITPAETFDVDQEINRRLKGE